MSKHLRIILKHTHIMEYITRFIQTLDFSTMAPKITPGRTVYNVGNKMSLLPRRLAPTNFSVISHLRTADYRLLSHYSGNWNTPRRSWLDKTFSRIEIMRYSVKSDKEGSTKPSSKDNTVSEIPKVQDKKSEEQKKIISGAEAIKTESNSSGAKIIETDTDAKVKEVKAKADVAAVKNEKIRATNKAISTISSDAKLKDAVARGTEEKVGAIKSKIQASSINPTEEIINKKIPKERVAEKKLGSMQAKLGVVEAKLSQLPQPRFSGSDYAMKPKELLKEISQYRKRSQRKIIIDNANESGFFKKINKLRLQKWKRFPKSRIEDYKKNEKKKR